MLFHVAIMAVDIIDGAASLRYEREVLLSTLVVRTVRYPVQRELVEDVIRFWLLESKKIKKKLIKMYFNGI